MLHAIKGVGKKPQFFFLLGVICVLECLYPPSEWNGSRVQKAEIMMNQTHPELDGVMQITLNRKEASMLEESLDHCYRMFGGNDLEYDEMIIDVRRQISSKNNIREMNIV
tara:strand:- start:266 stop:595 length:330 start_codon:yes stop_codon:yes gene_type:complete